MNIFIVDDRFADRLVKYKVISLLKGMPKNTTNIKYTKRRISLALLREAIVSGERFLQRKF